MRILELRHVEPEGPAGYLPALERFGEVVTVRAWLQPMPPADGWDAAIVMGGPMGVPDAAEVPWLAAELRLLGDLVSRGVPVWGVCLGAQLLAAVLGARVLAGDAPEVGVGDLALSSAGRRDPVWGGLPATFPALHLHGDTFDVPEGAELLASSAACPNQLFRAGSSYGVQFHLETDAAAAREWLAIPDYRRSLEQALGTGAVDRLLADLQAVSARTSAWAAQVMERWLASITA